MRELEEHLTSESVKSTGDILPMLESFSRDLRARNRSDRTIVSYRLAVRSLAEFLARKGMPAEVANITREHVETYITDLLETRTATTAAIRYRSLQQFFKWLVEEGEIQESPMRRMHAPAVEDKPPAVLNPDQLKALLKACKDSRRDLAMVTLFIDTGMRLGEISGIRVGDVDLDAGVIRVTGKRGTRFTAIAPKTIQAIDRYLRKRGSDSEWLWLGQKGRMTESGIAQMLKRRGAKAGIPHLHPHLFRHTFTHSMLAAGATEGETMQLGGWKSRSMLDRYGASAAFERAREAHRRFSPVERL